MKNNISCVRIKRDKNSHEYQIKKKQDNFSFRREVFAIESPQIKTNFQFAFFKKEGIFQSEQFHFDFDSRRKRKESAPEKKHPRENKLIMIILTLKAKEKNSKFQLFPLAKI